MSNFISRCMGVNISLYGSSVTSNYSILSLIQTPGDLRNLFALSGIRINRVRTNESILYILVTNISGVN